MTYELAKELKDAGFPQGDWDNQGEKYWSTYDGGASKKNPLLIDGNEVNYGFMEDVWRSPTLSELIEACGENFHMLVHDDGTWRAHAYSEGFSREQTSEEAVAKLWLALNKKS